MERAMIFPKSHAQVTERKGNMVRKQDRPAGEEWKAVLMEMVQGEDFLRPLVQGCATRPANVSSFSGCGDAVQLFGDVKEPAIEALESASSLLIGQPPRAHLEKVACGGQRLADAGKVSGGGAVGN